MGLTDTFTYDGVNSSDFGFYASGEATFDAPEKEYEVYEIPGRNGDLEVFNGRFKNITVTYPCVYHKLGNDFAGDMAQFRAALLSRHGYCRLYDSHHPEYYRMGICKSALTTNPTEHDLVSTLNVEFDCKPQRFLTSGEVPVTVASGDAITNPTEFESHPLLMANGYGNIQIGENTIGVTNTVLGKRKVADKVTDRSQTAYVSGPTEGNAFVTLDTSLMSAGDKIWFKGEDKCKYYFFFGEDGSEISDVMMSSINDLPFFPSLIKTNSQGLVLYLAYNDPRGSSYYYRYGTAKTQTENCTLTFTKGGTSYSITIAITLSYDGDDTIQLQVMFTVAGSSDSSEIVSVGYTQIPEIWAKTTLATSQETLYIDLENGMAYEYINGHYVSVNSSVWLGAELPTLKPGINSISYDSTITGLQVVPRWWTI